MNLYFQDLLDTFYLEFEDYGKVGKGKTNFGMEYVEVYMYTSEDGSDKYYTVEEHKVSEVPYDIKEVNFDKSVGWGYSVAHMEDRYEEEIVGADTLQKEFEFKTYQEVEEYLNKIEVKYDTFKECVESSEWFKEKVKEVEEEKVENEEVI